MEDGERSVTKHVPVILLIQPTVVLKLANALVYLAGLVAHVKKM